MFFFFLPFDTSYISLPNFMGISRVGGWLASEPPCYVRFFQPRVGTTARSWKGGVLFPVTYLTQTVLILCIYNIL